jgi:pimeloyl-ACP methyl ester carboxylesterase
MTSDKVGSRELITLDGDGVVVRGTYHKTTGSAASLPGHLGGGVGVVFLSALSSPRSLTADSAVFWANSFAHRGYPSFRIDLPGVGDSYGETPNDLLGFVNDGGFASITAVKIKELIQTFGLSGAVMFGHCAGATNAIWAASESKECRGLVLMDPYFNLPKSLTSKISPELVHWARRSALGAVIRATYDRLRQFPGALRTDDLPADANVAFIARWKKVVSSGIPILILKSPQAAALGSDKLRAGGFDYLGHITSFAVRSDQFTIRTLDETDHSFANRLGRLAVEHHTEAWLDDYFPVPTAKPIVSQEEKLPSMEINPAVLSTPVPAYVSSGEMGAI